MARLTNLMSIGLPMVMSDPALLSDRRGRRRQDTIEEVLDVAVEVMAEQGVAALSLAEVARRMGIRPPSLYQYFESKLAVYDAVFERGTRQLQDTIETAVAGHPDDPVAMLRRGNAVVIRWCQANPVPTQLMFWRTVPGFEPSERAFEASVRQMRFLHDVLTAAVAAGQLDPTVTSEEASALYTSLISGVITQQLANQPDAPPGEGRFARLAPTVLEMFLTRYAPKETT